MDQEIKEARLLSVRSGKNEAKGTSWSFAKFVCMEHGEMEFFVSSDQAPVLKAQEGLSGKLLVSWGFDRGRPRCELASFVPAGSRAAVAG